MNKLITVLLTASIFIVSQCREDFVEMTDPACAADTYWIDGNGVIDKSQAQPFPEGKINFNWNTVAGAEIYDIFITHADDSSKNVEIKNLPAKNGGSVTSEQTFAASLTPFSWYVDAKNNFQNMPGDFKCAALGTFMVTDKTLPVIDILNPPDSTFANGTFTIDGIASDSNGIVTVEYSLDGGITWILATGTNVWSFSLDTSSDLSVGSNTILVRALDGFSNYTNGNYTGVSDYVTDIDTIDILINPACPVLSTPDVCDVTPIFDWASVGGVTGYEFEVTDVADTTYASVLDDGGPTTIVTDQWDYSSAPLPLTAGVNYIWRVRSVQSVLGVDYFCSWVGSTFSPVNSATPTDATVAASPTSTCPGTVSLDWGAVPGHTYELRYKLTTSAVWITPSGCSPNCADTDAPVSESILTPSTPDVYEYEIRASTVCQIGSWVAISTFEVYNTPLDAPFTSSPTASVCATSPVTFTWSTVAAHLYTLEYQLNGTGAYVALSSGATLDTYTDTTFMSAGNSYNVRITINDAANSCGTLTNNAIYTTLSAPIAPSLTAPTSLCDGSSPLISWADGGDTYTLEYELNGAGGFSTISHSCGAGTCSYNGVPSTDFSLGTNYVFRLTVDNGCSATVGVNSAVMGVDTNASAVNITLQPTTPVNTTDNNTISWTDNAPETYTVFYKLSTDTTWTATSGSPTCAAGTCTYAGRPAADWINTKTYNFKIVGTLSNGCPASDPEVISASFVIAVGCTTPTGTLTLIDPVGGATLYQEVKPGFYWEDLGVSGQTGYEIEISETSTFAVTLGGSPYTTSTNVSYESLDPIPSGLYAVAPNITKTLYWRVTPINGVTSCRGITSPVATFNIRFLDSTVCQNMDTGTILGGYNANSMFPTGVEIMPQPGAASGIGTTYSDVWIAIKNDALSPPGSYGNPRFIPGLEILSSTGTSLGSFWIGPNNPNCTFYSDIIVDPVTNHFYLTCQVGTASEMSKIHHYDDNFNLVGTIPISNTIRGSGIDFDGTNFWVSDNTILGSIAAPTADRPVRKYSLAGGAAILDYNVYGPTAPEIQYGYHGVRADVPNNRLYFTSRQWNGAATTNRDVQAYDATTGAYLWSFEGPPVAAGFSGTWDGDSSMSNIFGPPIPAGPPYGKAPSGRYMVVTEYNNGFGGQGWALIYRVTDMKARYVGAASCAGGGLDYPFDVVVAPTDYTMMVSVVQNGIGTSFALKGLNTTAP